MKIILIAGTWYQKKAYEGIWGNLRKELEARYPGAEICAESVWYHPWEIEKIRELGESILTQHDTGEDLLLIGHSMGGITACGIAEDFAKSRVLGIATIFTPHHMGAVHPLLDFKERLGYAYTAPPRRIPVLSFGGIVDPLVWFFFTRHTNARQHKLVFSDHRFILSMSRRVARFIAHTIYTQFPLQAQ